jgi:hydroxyacylglutathione hydrolase
MILDRVEAPTWLSNAYLIADRPGGSGVIVDGNGVMGPLLERIANEDITITHILVTHHHMDHVVDLAGLKAALGVPVLAHADTAKELGDGIVDGHIADGDVIKSGDLEIVAINTPGHCQGHLAFLIDGTDCITADVIFKGTVGGCAGPGGNYEQLVDSIMGRLLTLPPETRLHPGHCEATTVAEELEHNPFVRIWRGVDPEGTEAVKVRLEPATLLLWGPDYDGTNKALVEFSPGRRAVIGGSQVVR